MNYSKEIIWGRYALNNKKISRTQLQKCIEEQGILKGRGIEKPLVELLLEKGYIDNQSAEQVRLLKGMIPGYEMHEILGSGGLGVVYKARSEKHNQDVAIKILNPEYTDNTIILGRFLREVDISKQLDHPNIVKGIDSGREEDLYYLVLEYIDGSSLASFTSKDSSTREESIISIAIEVTKALSYAWKKGLTHRDIKPENIMFTDTGMVKVCDFGLAKLADANVALTLSGTIVGSPYYVSPEQAVGSTDLDYRSDIYSLGATLYFLATGRVLFEEKTLIAICNAHVNVDPLPPSTYVTISPLLEEMIMKMLSKNPADRCSSPEAFVDYLNTVVTQVNSGEADPKIFSQEPGKSDIAVVILAPADTRRTDLCRELKKASFKTVSFEVAEEAYKYCLYKTPELIISSLRSGNIDGWDFQQKIKTAENVQNVPFIFIDSKLDIKTRMRAMLAGVNLYLANPIQESDIEKIITAGHTSKSKTDSRRIELNKLKGNLSLMKPPEIFQILETSKKTGILHIKKGTNKAKSYFRDGKIFHCELGSFSAEGAVCQLLIWDTGYFQFNEMVSMDHEETLSGNTLGYVLDAMRAIDDIKRLKNAFGVDFREDYLFARLGIIEGIFELADIFEAIEEFKTIGKPGGFKDYLRKNEALTKEGIEFLEKLDEEMNKRQDTKKLSGQEEKKSETTKINLKPPSTSTQSSYGGAKKESIEDKILQHLALGLSILDMTQHYDCIQLQVDLQIQGTKRSLGDILVESGYVTPEHLQYLYTLRDEQGNSLIPAYEVVHKLGEGGLAVVYLARQISTNTSVALKVFAPGATETASTIARFMREGEAAKNLEHPNIVKAHDFGSVHGLYYLVMEYIPGLSLSQILGEMGRMEEGRAIKILEQLVSALTYAWKQGIIHRDIKPGNILFAGDYVKICDLGLAKVLDSELEVTQPGAILGTPYYMSPEQFQPEKPLDYRSDIYSLGVTFYVMLTGQLPFTASTQMGIAQAHISAEVPPLDRFNIEISVPCKALVKKMLEKVPEKRALEMEELKEDVERVKNGKLPKNVTYKTEKKNGEKTKLKYIVVATIVTALLVVVGLVSSYKGQPDKTSRPARENDSGTKISPPEVKPLPKVTDKEPPIIVFQSPKGLKDQQTIKYKKRTITIAGYAQDNGEVKGIQVNDKEVFMMFAEDKAKFKTSITLKVGVQMVNVIARDKAGNAKQISFIAQYEPPKKVYTIKVPISITIEGNTAKKIPIVFLENGKRISVSNKEWTWKAESGKCVNGLYKAPPSPGMDFITVSHPKISNSSLIKVVITPPKYRQPVYHTPTKNKKGYYERTFFNNHLMIWIPNKKKYLKPSRKNYRRGFWISKYEVSNEQYNRYLKSKKILYHLSPQQGTMPKGYLTQKKYANYPVIWVTWRNARDYCNWVNKELRLQKNKILRLETRRFNVRMPSLKEIMKTSGSNPNQFPWGSSLPGAQIPYRCNYDATYKLKDKSDPRDGFKFTAPITYFGGQTGNGGDGVSPFGLYNLSGNVSEWSWDSDKYMQKEKVIYGGSWKSRMEMLKFNEISLESRSPMFQLDTIGFRIVFTHR